MAEKRRKFDSEFREGAIRIVRETGRPIAQIACELGVNEATLTTWVARDRQQRRANESDGGLSESEREELQRLRRENAELAMERDDAPMFVKSSRGLFRQVTVRL
ncbi:transposase [Nocardia sp. NPDC052278]|uniref:transposase n=1 Tax=unclassified Nocardia TaxID=2637762 RepID=UPI003699425F